MKITSIMQIPERVSNHNHVGVRKKEAAAKMDISKSIVNSTKMNCLAKSAKTNGEEIQNTNMVSSSSSQGFLALGTPQEPIDDNGTIIMPVPHLTELGTSTLAQLYQSSRRSRSGPPDTKTSNPVVIHPQTISPPPLTISLPLVGGQKLHDLNVANEDAIDDEWLSFNMTSPMSRSCSAMSSSSMESDDEDLLL